MRTVEEYVGESVMRMDMDGRRRKGRVMWRWVDIYGQCKCGVEEEGTVGGGDIKPGCVEATGETSIPNRSGKKML